MAKRGRARITLSGYGILGLDFIWLFFAITAIRFSRAPIGDEARRRAQCCCVCAKLLKRLLRFGDEYAKPGVRAVAAENAHEGRLAVRCVLAGRLADSGGVALEVE